MSPASQRAEHCRCAWGYKWRKSAMGGPFPFGPDLSNRQGRVRDASRQSNPVPLARVECFRLIRCILARGLPPPRHCIA